MNVVVIKNAILSQYFKESFRHNQIIRYTNWIRNFVMTGEVALSNCLVRNEYGNDKFFVVSNVGPNDNQHSIVVYSSLWGDENKIKDLPVMCSIDGDGFYIGIPYQENEGWGRAGIKTMDDLRQSEREIIYQDGTIGAALFAKINTDAFKCQRKIIRLSNAERRSPEVKQGDPYDDSHYKSIVLSPGFKYSYQTGLSMPRSFTRHCEAWGVRGHYRHYKNGKVVYIAPYQKGKGRLKQTTYKIKEKTA